MRVLEELLPAKNHSHMLGLKLGLPLHDIEGIQSNYHDPRDRLLKVITEFLRQEQTGPTWRVIVDALRSPVVNLPALAKRVEAAHFPDAIPTRDAVPETTTGMAPLNYDWSNSVSIISAAESVASTTTDTSGDVVKSKTPSQLSSGEKSTGVMMESERTSMAQQHWVPKCWSAWRASVEQTKSKSTSAWSGILICVCFRCEKGD